MILKFFLIFSCFNISLLFSIPPKEIPTDLYNLYTMNNAIPVIEYYFDNSFSSNPHLVYREETVNQYIDKAKRREEGYYGNTDTYLYSLLDLHRSNIEGQNIGIIGSTIPWYESIVLAYGAHPITLDYNKIISEDCRLQVMTVEEYDQNPIQFDSIISISSLEHDGLGRYGDPLNPWGDIETMQKMKKMLKKEGLLFLAVPVGKDTLFWNAHRIYGALRLPLLLNGWEILDTRGFSTADYGRVHYGEHQPLFVLRPK